jgi:hypothetical protein
MSKVKLNIALIGNMNNNLFSLHRYLIKSGYTSTLYLFNNELEHFYPVADTWHIDVYKESIVKLKLGNPYYDLRVNDFQRIMGKHNFLIGCGYAPYYCHRSGLDLDLFVPYGADLYELPRNKKRINFDSGVLAFIKSAILYLLNIRISQIQKRGIKRAKNVISTNILKTFRDAGTFLGIDFMDLGVPLVYLEELPKVELLRGSFYNNCEKLSSFDFVVGSQSRQYWTAVIDSASTDNLKRNDILIKGFASFLKRTQTNSCLVLFQYGPDVNASQDLISQLEIEKNVIWFEKCQRKEILFLFNKYVDIGADQFLSGYFGGTGYEILSQGVPLLATINISNEEYYKQTGRFLPPHINVSSGDGVCAALELFYNNPDRLRKLSVDSKNWFEKNLGEGLFKKYEELFFQA